jgi:hypothetical protein
MGCCEALNPSHSRPCTFRMDSGSSCAVRVSSDRGSIGYMLRGKRYYRLDLKDWFYHIAMALDSIKNILFVTPMGQFEYLRMPFDLKERD